MENMQFNISTKQLWIITSRTYTLDALNGVWSVMLNKDELVLEHQLYSNDSPIEEIHCECNGDVYISDRSKSHSHALVNFNGDKTSHISFTMKPGSYSIITSLTNERIVSRMRISLKSECEDRLIAIGSKLQSLDDQTSNRLIKYFEALVNIELGYSYDDGRRRLSYKKVKDDIEVNTSDIDEEDVFNMDV